MPGPSPGSALALEKGKVTANTVINCAPGRMTIGTATISMLTPTVPLTVAQVIQKSSNIGAGQDGPELSAGNHVEDVR